MTFSFKTSTHHRNKKARIFSWMALVSGIGFSSFVTVFSVALEEKLQNEVHVGYYLAITAFVALLTSLLSTVVLKKIPKVLVAKASLFLICEAFFLFTIAASIWQLLIFDMIRMICVTMFLITLAMFVRDSAEENQIAIAEGKYYFFTNIGWMIGPFVGGMLAGSFGNEATYIFAGIMYLITLFLLAHQHMIVKNPSLESEKEEMTLTEFWYNIRDYFQKPQLIRCFIIGFGMYFWWCLYKIYIPLMVTDLGFSKGVMGTVLSLSMIPPIALELWITKKAQKKGVKKYLIFGYLWLALFAILYVLFKIPIVILGAIILANIGIAFVEPLSDANFFQTVEKKDEEKFYGIYNTAYPLSNIVTPLFGSMVIALVGIKGIWIIAAIVFVSVAALVAKTKKALPSKN